MWMVLLLILGVYSFMDIRKKEISVGGLTAGIVLSVFISIRENLLQNPEREVGFIWQQYFASLIIGMLPGLVMILLSFVLRGKIGIGDGLVLIVIGNITGIRGCIFILTMAIVLSFFYSCIQLIFFRKNRNDCFPFIPFYLCAAAMAGMVGFGAG